MSDKEAAVLVRAIALEGLPLGRRPAFEDNALENVAYFDLSATDVLSWSTH